ncbi:MAG: hypothetical protein CM15mV29_0050 [uncultured marine virus]|jgi:hypothetical protein|nr:MAG: hypothetical protein CM15mV29_0050 [uncultured marine virus]
MAETQTPTTKPEDSTEPVNFVTNKDEGMRVFLTNIWVRDNGYKGYTWEEGSFVGSPESHWVRYMTVTTPTGEKIETYLTNKASLDVMRTNQLAWVNRHIQDQLILADAPSDEDYYNWLAVEFDE